ncbi:MAG: T9SS type A sorting domain-containing protein, partial [Flavobacteriales bacterium]|nr:T9SS type A sorting domain-containing protein [Flavobacteriales bacterium]
NGNANTDGVVIGYNYFGSSDKGSFSLSAPFDKGRTATHEIGHCFGLLHTFQGGCGTSNCAASGDYCCDTPPVSTANYGCPSTNSCSNDSPNLPDQVQNYMDYTDDACMNMFTADQKTRVLQVMANSPRRSTLPTSTVCGTPSLTAAFSGTPTTINAGQTVTFTDASTGPNTITSWTWNFDVNSLGGVTPATASTQGPHVVTYNNPGTYTVSLMVGDGTSTDTDQKNSYIIVNPVGTQACDSTLATWDINNSTHTSSTGVYLWSGGNGYILGRNAYGDNGWADKISYTGSGDFLTDVFYYFGVAKGTGNVNLKVWGETGSLPNNGNVMATVSAANTSLATGGTPTLWTISSPPALTGNFYVGFDHTSFATGDTVALMSAPTGTNTVYAKETGGWINLSNYGLTHSAAVIPVVCNSIATGEKEILGNINEILVFPNPSNGTINVALTEKTLSSVDVYNVVGKLVRSTQPLNTQLITINIDDQPNGIYFINVKTGGNVITKKVVISK